MGKIDDMRRLREEEFARLQRGRAKAPPAPVATPRVSAPVPAAVVAPAARAAPPGPADEGDAEAELAQPSRPTRPTSAKKKTSSKSGGAADEQGKCPVCGKMKPLSNGVLAQHQKGFGKACTGSRKKPV